MTVCFVLNTMFIQRYCDCKAIAKPLQSDCKAIAKPLQSDCKAIAKPLQWGAMGMHGSED
jgi:hypothetical protein